MGSEKGRILFAVRRGWKCKDTDEKVVQVRLADEIMTLEVIRNKKRFGITFESICSLDAPDKGEMGQYDET